MELKKTRLPIWVLMLLWIPFLCGCELDDERCLPYEGEIFPSSYLGYFGFSCNGVVIKVTNASVNSSWEWNGKTHDDVIVVRIPEGVGFEEFFGFPIDEAKAVQRFYFDFRDLDPSEEHFCTMEYSEPSRRVYMTRFALTRCGYVNRNER
ncbi:hypothetical protein A33Q_0139 [Indibacter alkaliphilus LW1]|uniref:Uncharacterized protein n=1 Tax=Indibacter alkaliphilus (strain CCUG 57479 / KCTC 22604 / LW1) TaxID=1189612 RepID=S2DMS0_INDAL|nr:hypothetical protein [Indibacter alkaliphilus]EPA00268.1 hypothetical protein A33Q_0139 [Indibacter alkaliphilus LW1]